MKKLIKITPLLLLTAFTAWGQSNYTALNGPYIGTPRKIVNTGTALLGINYGMGIFKSTDGGLNWVPTSLVNLYPEDIYRDATSGKLYVITYNQLYTSTDGGTTWTLTANSGFTSGRFIRKTSSYVYIVGYGILYRSSNDGTTWAQVNTFGGYAYDFEVNGSAYLFIATDQGVWRSTNNGLNVEQLDADQGLADTYVQALTISGTSHYALTYSGLYKSTNNGTNWSPAMGTSPTNITDTFFGYGATLETDPSGNVYVGVYGNLWKSSNGGSSWTLATTPYSNDVGGILVGAYHESSTTFYMGIDGHALFKTIDGGTSWTQVGTGITASTPDDLVMTSNGRLLYARSYPNGFFMSIDDGASWDFLGSGVTARQVSGFQAVGSTVYAYGSGIIKTLDNGSNWSEVSYMYYFSSLATSDGVNMYSVSTDYGPVPPVHTLLSSTDGGVNWTSATMSGMPSADCSYLNETNLFVSSGGDLFAYYYTYGACGSGARLYKINPATASASQVTTVPSGGSIQDIDYFNGKLYVFTSNSRLHVSSDEGLTWTTYTTSTSGGYLEVISSSTLYILNSAVFLSNDGGLTWTNTGSPGGTNKYNRKILISPANYSYVAQDYDRVYKSNSPVVPPAAPTNLRTTFVAHNRIGIIFDDNSTNEDRFVIELAVGGSTTFDSVAWTTRTSSWTRSEATSVVVADKAGITLTANTQYKIRVKASGSGGKSSPSNEISVTTLTDCTTTSAIPLNRSWTATTLNLSGVGVMTALDQTVSGSNGFFTVQNLPLGATAGLSPLPPGSSPAAIIENCGQVSMYSSSGYIANGNGVWDPSAKTITIPWITHPQYPYFSETTVYTLNAVDPAPEAPTNLAAGPYLPKQVLLNWTGGLFATEYEVERSTTSGGGFALIATVPHSLSFFIFYADTDPALLLGQTYYYRVRAKNSSGVSAYSGEVSIAPTDNYLFVPFNNLPAKTFDQTGGGGAWGDIDGDGIEDLALPILQDSLLKARPPAVFKGFGNGQFTRMNIAALDGENQATRNANIVDMNNDGRNDLYFVRTSGNHLILIQNPDGTFTKSSINVSGSTIQDAAWADYDNDSDLDLLQVSYISPGTASDRALYANNGDGTFERVLTGELATDASFSRCAAWADYDNDGDQDVLVLSRATSSTTQNQTRLYQNNGDGTLTRVLNSAFELPAVHQNNGMSAITATWSDFDNDGHLDVFIGTISTSSTFPNRIFWNNGDGTFTDDAGVSLGGDNTISYGSGAEDLDNDGDPDLVVTGNVINAIYFNNGNRTFTKYSNVELLNSPTLTKLYGPAFADVDGDGFVDLHLGGFSNPAIPNLIFRNSQTMTPSTKWIKFRMRGADSNFNGIGARVEIRTGAVYQIREVSAHSAHTTQSSPILHFGVGSATVIDEVNIYWPSGIAQSLYGVTPNQLLDVIEDGDEPVITALTPMPAAAIVPGLTQLTLTFDEESFGASGTYVKIYDAATNAVVRSMEASTATKSGNTLTYTFAAINTLGAYYVLVDPYAFHDVWNNSFGGILNPTTWVFTMVDDTAPVISFTEVSNYEIGSGGLTLTINVTDNVAPTSARMYYRKIGSASAPNVSASVAVSGGKADFSAQDSWFDEMGLEYYFEALDAAGNIGRSPSGTNSYHCFLTFSAGNQPMLPPTTPGGSVSAYEVISIPYELPSRSTSQVFESLGPQDKEKWRLLGYKEPQAWVDYPSTIDRGKGYFINVKDAVSAISLEGAESPSNHQGNPFKLNLSQGFNLIGNPYTFSIRWQDVADAYGGTVTIDPPIAFNGSGYSGTSTLGVFQGAFVYAEGSVSGLVIPVINASGSRYAATEFTETRLDQPGWQLDLKLRQGSAESIVGGLGMQPEASSARDRYDRISPPRFIDFLEINFSHPEHPARYFYRDIVPTAPEGAWNFSVSSSYAGTADLSWDNSGFGDNQKDLFLLDLSRQYLVDMREVSSYRFDPARNKEFAVYYGENLKEKIRPTRLGLGESFPNPFSNFVSLPLSLPENQGGYQVAVEVYNSLGVRVRSGGNVRFEGGFYELTWDGQNDQTDPVKPGMYFFRVRVSHENGTQTYTSRIIKQ
jgi:hypothetical protein